MEFELCELVSSSRQEVFRVFSQNHDDYFNVFGNDAEHLAEDFFSNKDLLRKQDVGGKVGSVSMLYIRPQKLESALRHVLVSDKREIELYIKTEEGNWKLSRKASPEHLESLTNMLSNSESFGQSNIIMAINMSGKNIGVSFLDPQEKWIRLCQFQDTDQLCDLESLLIQISPQQCLVPANSSTGEMQFMKQKLQLSNITVVEKKSHCFKSDSVSQDLKRLSSSDDSFRELFELKVALSSFACLSEHLKLLTDDKKYDIMQFQLSQYMKLDNGALRSLNLFPTTNDVSRFSSLFGLLNHCRTAMGERLLGKWIKQPLLDLNNIKTRQDLVEIFVNDAEIRESLNSQHLRRMMDFDKLLNKIRNGKSTLKDCVTLYVACESISKIAMVLSSYRDDNVEILQDQLLNSLKECSENFENFREMVEQTIDLKAVDNHEYIVNAEFSPDLAILSKRKAKLKSEIDSLLEQVSDQLGLDQKKLKQAHSSVHGYHFRISRAHEKKLRGSKDFVYLETRKDGVKFTTRKLKKLSESYESLNEEYTSIQTIVVEKIVEILSTYSPVIEKASFAIAQVDVFVSLAMAACSSPIPYCKPEIRPMEERKISLKASRHACLEAQDGTNIIPNDVLIDESSRLQIITGPNMGGKSVFCKQIGMIVLMAQMGSFVPCEEASISLVDAVLARVGAGDSQLAGVSTFMSEMLEASSILQTATKYSLLIVDELGRGTSTYDGFGLAWAISEHIATHLESFCLFATHFHELTTLSEHIPFVVNKHVTAHTTDKSITMLYEIREGACDQSFGIHVAELAQFPESVVSLARVKVKELEGSQTSSAKSILKQFKDLDLQNVSDEQLSQLLCS